MTSRVLQNPIVFSDLDGTLLDHETYEYEAAAPALEQLKIRKIPLILASSKTAAELIPLRHRMGFDHCDAIVENGAGILPAGEMTGGDDSHLDNIFAILDAAPPAMRGHFAGFSQWSVDEVSARTGLAADQARAAKQRQFSEVGQWSGSNNQWAEFQDYLTGQGLSVHRGGRFISLSFSAGKAARMQAIAEEHRRINGSAFVVALGDAPNDIAMLEAADLGIIIPNPGHQGIAALDGEVTGSIIRADRPAPIGWNTAILELIE